jgi:hypothetical protein
MNYTIIVKGFRNKGARMVVARHLMREAGITLQEALARTEHLPVTLFRSVGSETVGATIDRYSRLGIGVQAIEAIPRTTAVRENDKTLIPSVDAPGIRGGVHYRETPDRSTLNRQLVGIPPPLPFPALPKRRSSMSHRNWMILGGSIVFAAAVLYGLFLISNPSAPANDGRALMKKSKAGLLDATSRSVTPAAREQARLLADSAHTFGNDAESAIRFYTMAIAFNKYNLNAWFGLLDAYQRSGRTRDMETTRQAIRDIFGERGISIESIIRPFGDCAEMHSENGTLTIEYHTKSPLVREKLIHETFLIYRAIRNGCDCSALSLYAFRDGSTGLVVHLSTREEIMSAAEFEQKATVRFFDAPARN